MSNFNHSTDESLMGLLQKGDTVALDEIYKRYSKNLLALMYRLLQCNEALAQDLLHDMFLKIIERPEQFDVSRKFKPWIYTIATNACRKTYRTNKTVGLDAIQDRTTPDNTPAQELDQKQLNHSLNQAIRELSYEHKEVFVLKHQQDLSIKEIANVVQCAEGTVKSRLFTSRKLLAEKLKSYHPNFAL
jgi:RNA polymerase sigma-70 factor (ECF subfamily)